jgi:hypothetical protein
MTVKIFTSNRLLPTPAPLRLLVCSLDTGVCDSRCSVTTTIRFALCMHVDKHFMFNTTIHFIVPFFGGVRHNFDVRIVPYDVPLYDVLRPVLPTATGTVTRQFASRHIHGPSRCIVTRHVTKSRRPRAHVKMATFLHKAFSVATFICIFFLLRAPFT